MRKPTFFERLTGSIAPEDYDDLFDADDAQRPHALADDDAQDTRTFKPQQSAAKSSALQADIPDEEIEVEQEGELAVDVYQTPDHIVVKALVAGVNPSNLDISLTRDMITIRGRREEHQEVEGDNYFYHELYWGGFTRTILLPEEVDVDEAEASTAHGILVIRLPKINKDRQTKLKVKAR